MDSSERVNSMISGAALSLCCFAAWAQSQDRPPAARVQPGTPAQAGPFAPAQPKPPSPLSEANYSYATGAERGRWFLSATAGPTSLLGAGLLSAAWGTMRKNPEEYGPHWEGFGKRYGMRLTGVSTGNAIEALAGAALKEDPRYIPAAPGTPFRLRVRYIIKTTFTSFTPGGTQRFSYSRLAGNVGNNFLSNLWRVESEASVRDASVRCVFGITGRMGSNAFAEFWPSVARKIKKK